MTNSAPRSLVFAAAIAAAIAASALVASRAEAQSPPATTAAPPTGAPGADPAPAPSAAQISYEVGLTFGTQLHSSGVSTEVDVDTLTRGLRDGLQGKKTTAAAQQQIQAFIRSVQDKATSRNLTAATDFLASNGKAPGVMTTASGLEYKVLVPGDKRAPAINAADTVTVRYRGKFLDGTEFDSSYSRNAPDTFPVTGVIKGWQEALVLMKPGAKWQVWVPPSLGYGSNWQAKMPGGSLLAFDIDLVSVTPVGTPPGTTNTAPTAPPGTPKGSPKGH